MDSTRFAAQRSNTPELCTTPEDEKLHAADLLLVAAEACSALALCGVLNWVAA